MEDDTGSVDERTGLLNAAAAINSPAYNAINASSEQQHSRSESSESAVEDEELQYDLARVNSHPTGLGVESSAEETRAFRSKGHGRASSQRSIGQQQGTWEDADIHEVEDAEAETKFIGVTRGRFWLVFGGILFAYFVCILAVTYHRKADVIEGCMFRLHAHGI